MVSTDSTPPRRAPSASACEAYRDLIVDAVASGRNAMAIWQDLVDTHGFAARYASVRRFVKTQGFRVWYREAHVLLEELAEATLDGTRKDYLADLTTVALLIIDDLGMRTLPPTSAEDLLIMRRYERASTLLTSNRPVDDFGEAPE